MGFVSRINTDIGSVNRESRETEALAMELDFGQLTEVALAVDDAKPVVMDHYVVEVWLVEVAVASIATLKFVDTFCSVD